MDSNSSITIPLPFPDPQSPSDLIRGVQQAIVNQQFVSLAVFTILLYDILITFDQEVNHLYVRSPSLVQVLWFLNRGLIPVQVGVHVLVSFWPNPAHSLCHIAGSYIGNWIGVVNLLIIQISLALRTAAVYGRSTAIIIILVILLLASTSSRIVILILHPVLNASVKIANRPGVCLDFPSLANSAVFYGPIALDATLYVMTVVGLFIQKSRCSKIGHGMLVRRMKNGTSLFSVLYRDGSIYFLVVAIAMTLAVLGFFEPPLLGAFTESDLYIVVCSIACSRLILHLKESSEDLWNESSLEERAVTTPEEERGGSGDQDGEDETQMSSQLELGTWLGFSALISDSVERSSVNPR